MNPNWNYGPFEQTFKWKEKSRIKSGDGKSVGKYKMFVCSDTEIKHYDKYLESGESLVFGTGGKASCHFVNEPFAYSTDCVVAQRKSNNTLSKCYYYYLRKNRLGELQSTFTGTGLQHTSKKKIGKILVPILSYEEQERIVTRLEELFSQLDNGIETLQTIKKQLTVYRQAVLNEAFNLLSDCEKGSIQSVCEAIVDCPHSTPKWVSEGKLCLRTTNFKRGYLDLSEKNYVTPATFEKRNVRLVPRGGDVLYSREGAILGIACIIPQELEVCLGQRMMLLRTNEQMNNKFLMYYLNSPSVTNHVVSITGGSASPHINVGDIKKYIVPIPSINIQNSVVNYIEEKMSTCDHIELTVDTTLQQAEALRQSILKEAFEGRLI